MQPTQDRLIRIGHKIYALHAGLVIGNGGASTVYRHPKSRRLAIKVVDQPQPLDFHRYEALMNNPPAPLYSWGFPFFGWPLETAFDVATGIATGFVQPRIPKQPVPVKAVVNPQNRIPQINQRWLLEVSNNFAWRIYSAHLSGYEGIDINLKNALVNRSAQVSIIDCDSFGFRTADGTVFNSPLAVPEFLPPELLGVELATAERAADQDAWMALTAIHMLLRQGTHPFDAEYTGRGKRKKGFARIKEGIWAESGQFPDYAPTPNASPFQSLPGELQEIFIRMFCRGHTERNERPSIAHIVACLEHLVQSGTWL